MKKVFAILLVLSAFAVALQGCAPAAEEGKAPEAGKTEETK